MNKAQKKMFYLLIISSVVMFLSMFTLSYKLLGIGLLQWIVVIILAFRTTMLRNFSFNKFAEYNEKVLGESFKEKKYVKSAVYGIVSPMMIVACMFLIMALSVMIFIL